MSKVLNDWLSALGLAPKPAGQRIFISYRRRDSSGYAGRVADRLVKEFGEEQCFRDIEDIESGTDFMNAIEQAVGACDALIVVIGPEWLNVKDPAGNRRLDDPRDFVRLEIAAALQRDVRVIPVLVGGANMPTAEELPTSINRLAYRQATEITDSRWDYDVGRLVTTLETMGIPRVNAKNTKVTPNYRKRMVAAAGTFVLVVSGAIGGASMVINSNQPDGPIYTPVNPPVNGADLTNRPDLKQTDVKPNEPAPERTRNPQPYVAPQAYVAPQPSDESVQRARILQTLNQADHVSAEALRTHNTSQLTQYFTGQALADQLSAVQALAGAGVHIHATLHNRVINNLRIAGDQVVIEQILEYDVEFRNPQEQCVQRVPRHNSDQIITMVQQNGRWLVTHENVLTASEPQVCY